MRWVSNFRYVSLARQEPLYDVRGVNGGLGTDGTSDQRGQHFSSEDTLSELYGSYTFTACNVGIRQQRAISENAEK